MDKFPIARTTHTQLQPGIYRYKRYSLLPWVTVQIIKDSIHSPNILRIRCAGLTLPTEPFLTKGEWQGPLHIA